MLKDDGVLIEHDVRTRSDTKNKDRCSGYGHNSLAHILVSCKFLFGPS